jgi:HSP20 family protein
MAKVSKNPKRRSPSDESEGGDSPVNFNFKLGGVLGKLGGMMEKLADLAEAGQSLSQSGEIGGLDPKGKLRGVYGFSVRTGIGQQGGQEIRVEPFGNVRSDRSGEAVFDDVREPLVDVHEEEDHVLVLAEIPGVSKKDVQLDLSGDRLTVRAQRGEKRYCKEVALPERFEQESMHWECSNGILKIRFDRS